MPKCSYIKVILPLKLPWLPTYRVWGDVGIGTRLKVRLAGKEYSGVVAETDVIPEMGESKISDVVEIQSCLEPVSENELKLWHFISDYYLCALGDAYKTAYPSTRVKTEARKARNKTVPGVNPETRKAGLDAREKEAVISILEHFNDKKSVLLDGDRRRGIYRELICRSLSEGRSVLLICPDAAICHELIETGLNVNALEFNSSMSQEQRRNVTYAIRCSSPSNPLLIVSDKSGIFLPFSYLGLVIVDEEHDEHFKNSITSPRYNARDCAAMLARIHGSNMLLGSSTPSLETLYNCQCGRYARVIAESAAKGVKTVVDTSAELRKNGMVNGFSRIAIKDIENATSIGKVLVICPRGKEGDIEIDARKIFTGHPGRIQYCDLKTALRSDLKKYELLLLLRGEYLVSRTDFRADEKALRLISELESRAKRLIVQTSDGSHPVFNSADASDLLMQRKEFGFPPFSRIVDVVLTDNNSARLAKLSGELSKRLSYNFTANGPVPYSEKEARVRVLFKKDGALTESKKLLLRTVEDFGKFTKYGAHIHLDVDPV